MEQEQQMDYLMEKKIQLLVEIATKEYGVKLQALQEQLSAANQEIATLKTSVKNIRSERPAAPVQQQLPTSAPVAEPSNPQTQQQTTPLREIPGETSTVNTSSGELTSEDVSIDKFFYCGQR